MIVPNTVPTAFLTSTSLYLLTSHSFLAFSQAAPAQKTIIGYYASWQWYDNANRAKPGNLDFTKVSRVNFAFFEPNVEGQLFGTDSWADPQVLFGPYDWNPSPGAVEYCSHDSPGETSCAAHHYEEGLLHLAHAAGAEVWPSLGGWTLSDPFPTIAASSATRSVFAKECVSLLRDYGFDGIDLDWEYPGYAAHSGTQADRENFNLLLAAIRFELDSYSALTGKTYGLTAALPCGPNHMNNMDIPYLENVLTEHNLMTYDFYGAWDRTTGINAPLYYQGFGSHEYSIHQCVQNWLTAGATPEKINIGMPFYGRTFASATSLDSSHTGVDKVHWQTPEGQEGCPSYAHIVPMLPLLNVAPHEASKTPVAYFPEGGFLSFDNEESICEKTAYVLEHQLNGYIIWELSGDLMSDLSTPLLDAMNAKLAAPAMSCAEYSSITTPGTTLPPTPVTPSGVDMTTSSPTNVPYPASACSLMEGDVTCNGHGVQVCQPTEEEAGCWVPKWAYPNNFCEHRTTACQSWETLQGGDSWHECCGNNDHCTGTGLAVPSSLAAVPTTTGEQSSLGSSAALLCSCECFTGWSGNQCDICQSAEEDDDTESPTITIPPTVSPTIKATLINTMAPTLTTTTTTSEPEDSDLCMHQCYAILNSEGNWYDLLVHSWCQLDCTSMVAFFPTRCSAGCRPAMKASL